MGPQLMDEKSNERSKRWNLEIWVNDATARVQTKKPTQHVITGVKVPVAPVVAANLLDPLGNPFQVNALGATAALRSTRIASRRPGTNIFVRSAAPAGATAIAPTQPLAIHPSGLLPVQFNSFNRTAVLLDPNFYAAQAQAAPTAAYTQIHAAGYDIPQMVQPVWPAGTFAAPLGTPTAYIPQYSNTATHRYISASQVGQGATAALSSLYTPATATQQQVYTTGQLFDPYQQGTLTPTTPNTAAAIRNYRYHPY